MRESEKIRLELLGESAEDELDESSQQEPVQIGKKDLLALCLSGFMTIALPLTLILVFIILVVLLIFT